MSTDEAAQRLRQAAPVQRVDTWTAYSVMVSESDLRALLDERDTLHARIKDSEALAKAIDAWMWNDFDGNLRWKYAVADAVVAYLTSAPEASA